MYALVRPSVCPLVNSCLRVRHITHTLMQGTPTPRNTTTCTGVRRRDRVCFSWLLASATGYLEKHSKYLSDVPLAWVSLSMCVCVFVCVVAVCYFWVFMTFKSIMSHDSDLASTPLDAPPLLSLSLFSFFFFVTPFPISTPLWVQFVRICCLHLAEVHPPMLQY